MHVGHRPRNLGLRGSVVASARELDLATQARHRWDDAGGVKIAAQCSDIGSRAKGSVTVATARQAKLPDTDPRGSPRSVP